MNGTIIKTVIIDKVDCKETKTSQNNGKQYCFCGIVINEKWYNGTMWEKQIDIVSQWKAKDKLTLVFFQEEYQGKIYSKFKIPTKTDLIYQEIDAIKRELFLIKEHINLKP